MSMTLSGSGSVTGLTPGGLPDATVATADIVDGAVSQLKLGANVAGNGPVFKAYNAGTQSLPAATYTKVVFNAKEFDTANCYDSTTNYRFTPTVAGYYLFMHNTYFATGTVNNIVVLYKNGGNTADVGRQSGTGGNVEVTGTALAYANGTTDYFELYAYSPSLNTLGASGNQTLWFSGTLIRSA